MTTLEKHNAEIKRTNYTGVVTDFNAYIQFGKVSCREDHTTIGYTAEYIKNIVAQLTSPEYLYARNTGTNIRFYGKDNSSPTGVSAIGGCPSELEFLLYAFGKTGSLSPTEDRRTAR